MKAEKIATTFIFVLVFLIQSSATSPPSPDILVSSLTQPNEIAYEGSTIYSGLELNPHKPYNISLPENRTQIMEGTCSKLADTRNIDLTSYVSGDFQNRTQIKNFSDLDGRSIKPYTELRISWEDRFTEDFPEDLESCFRSINIQAKYSQSKSYSLKRGEDLNLTLATDEGFILDGETKSSSIIDKLLESMLSLFGKPGESSTEIQFKSGDNSEIEIKNFSLNSQDTEVDCPKNWKSELINNEGAVNCILKDKNDRNELDLHAKADIVQNINKSYKMDLRSR